MADKVYFSDVLFTNNFQDFIFEAFKLISFNHFTFQGIYM